MISYLRHLPSGCYYYRTLQKMAALERGGIKTIIIDIDTDIDEEVYKEITAVQLYGIYPFRTENVIQKLKADGKRIIYDLDDPMDLADTSNPFYSAIQRDKWSYREILPLADEITVSTTKMSEYVRKSCPGGKITVLPNCYDETDWKFVRPQREGIRIGFAGSPTHLKDLFLILPAIKNLQKKYDIKFLLMGMGERQLDSDLSIIEQTTPELKEIVAKVKSLLQEISYEYVPFIPFDQYPSTLINMSLDFGLCPLTNTEFNQHRSAIKALEYLKSGATALASLMPGYSEEFTSILTLDNDWENKLEFCITHPEDVKKTRDQQLKWAKENKNINDQIDLLKKVYVG